MPSIVLNYLNKSAIDAPWFQKLKIGCAIDFQMPNLDYTLLEFANMCVGVILL